jgi:arylsulfatase A-like enzyme
MQHINRRQMMGMMGAAALAAAIPGPGLGADAGGRPNILFILTDDQRFDTLGALNNPAVRTPNIDRLVRGGTSFTHCFIQGSRQGAVSICSRSMILTGRSLFRSPQNPAARDELSLWPAVFRDAGYTTWFAGKWHNAPWSLTRGFARGGSVFFGGMADHVKLPVQDFSPEGNYSPAGRRPAGRFSCELFSDDAARFLEGYREPNPFFMLISYMAPHDPRMAPAEYAAMYPPDSIELPGNFLPEHPFDNGELKVRDEMLASFPRTGREIRQHIAGYYAMITHMDHHIGRVLDGLEKSGHAKNTIIIFAGDNGLAVGQHGLMGKQSMYDHSLRVPLVMSGPGIARGRTVDALVNLQDLFPTACELAGLPRPGTCESPSLAPLLAGSARAVRECVFGAYRDVQRMVRTDQYKLIVYPKVGRIQLFDMRADPLEKQDLSADPVHAQALARLKELLRQCQREAGDPLELKL